MVNRISIKVNPQFDKELKAIQRELTKLKGEKPSINKITMDIIKNPEFNKIKKQLLRDAQGFDVSIKFDGDIA